MTGSLGPSVLIEPGLRDYFRLLAVIDLELVGERGGTYGRNTLTRLRVTEKSA
jgi:hypothetical protein